MCSAAWPSQRSGRRLVLPLPAFARFDGFALSVELQQHSASLRNSNLATAVSQLHDVEEVVLATLGTA
jgi:hypothetical protein